MKQNFNQTMMLRELRSNILRNLSGPDLLALSLTNKTFYNVAAAHILFGKDKHITAVRKELLNAIFSSDGVRTFIACALAESVPDHLRTAMIESFILPLDGAGAASHFADESCDESMLALASACVNLDPSQVGVEHTKLYDNLCKFMDSFRGRVLGQNFIVDEEWHEIRRNLVPVVDVLSKLVPLMNKEQSDIFRTYYLDALTSNITVAVETSGLFAKTLSASSEVPQGIYSKLLGMLQGDDPLLWVAASRILKNFLERGLVFPIEVIKQLVKLVASATDGSVLSCVFNALASWQSATSEVVQEVFGFLVGFLKNDTDVKLWCNANQCLGEWISQHDIVAGIDLGLVELLFKRMGKTVQSGISSVGVTLNAVLERLPVEQIPDAVSKLLEEQASMESYHIRAAAVGGLSVLVVRMEESEIRDQIVSFLYGATDGERHEHVRRMAGVGLSKIIEAGVYSLGPIFDNMLPDLDARNAKDARRVAELAYHLSFTDSEREKIVAWLLDALTVEQEDLATCKILDALGKIFSSPEVEIPVGLPEKLLQQLDRDDYSIRGRVSDALKLIFGRRRLIPSLILDKVHAILAGEDDSLKRQISGVAAILPTGLKNRSNKFWLDVLAKPKSDTCFNAGVSKGLLGSSGFQYGAACAGLASFYSRQATVPDHVLTALLAGAGDFEWVDSPGIYRNPIFIQANKLTAVKITWQAIIKIFRGKSEIPDCVIEKLKENLGTRFNDIAVNAIIALSFQLSASQIDMFSSLEPHTARSHWAVFLLGVVRSLTGARLGVQHAAAGIAARPSSHGFLASTGGGTAGGSKDDGCVSQLGGQAGGGGA